MDHKIMSGREIGNTGECYNFCGNEDVYLQNILFVLKEQARETNEEWADRLGINRSKQLTLIKPSGTVSQLVNSSSGIHPRYSKFYIRKVTQDNKDPLTQLLKDSNVPHQIRGDKTYFSFPIASPEGAITQKDMSALEQLELWKIYREHWCDGNPSQTIYYTDREFLDVQAWVWKNWDSIGGLSFFPVDDNVYEISPYNPCTQEEYEEAVRNFPMIEWEKLSLYETTDHTTSSQEYACAGGACDI